MVAKSKLSAVRAYPSSKQLFRQIRLNAQTNKDRWAASGANLEQLNLYIDDLNAHKEILLENEAAPDVQQFAKDQENDQAYDFLTESAAVRGFMDAIIAVITGAAPTSGGFVQDYSYNPDGSRDHRVFTAGQLIGAGLGTALDNLITSIEDPNA